ncbi:MULTISPECIES: nuclear transport factor 2 family protein [unclassified Bradyrhizobium]|uniref:nuclear transport factor 2 family protein n=1 Tax=unclassified Bradyrhizobium TaxID=2631580 RepID=UPI002478A458|nr:MULTISPECIES: nuclear transport factor 2 family protein [unclassified Bradyrhizobium]WGR71057.1 nuclear transport factor 2 family protein [Bradyrhizobium sp. ISRA426]WGR75894.1 nuclear transport factor 2 family protein [Bradyrhizobium sp. ISRA430]WGR86298.1 nuclear transport factor 2 family protein [Bradyrhizobium sp. ISRA432]
MSDFDQMGIVVDWVDACRKGDLATLLDLYADDAALECTCNDTRRYRGRSELETYWRSQLNAFSLAGFALEEIAPMPPGVDLEYSVAGSLHIRVSFRFSPEGKIERMLCAPAWQDLHDACVC